MVWTAGEDAEAWGVAFAHRVADGYEQVTDAEPIGVADFCSEVTHVNVFDPQCREVERWRTAYDAGANATSCGQRHAGRGTWHHVVIGDDQARLIPNDA